MKLGAMMDLRGVPGGTLGSGTVLQAVSIHDGVAGTFHGFSPSGRIMSGRIDSVSNRNEYQDYLLG
jgi:hypothetical protein